MLRNINFGRCLTKIKQHSTRKPQYQARVLIFELGEIFDKDDIFIYNTVS